MKNKNKKKNPSPLCVQKNYLQKCLFLSEDEALGTGLEEVSGACFSPFLGTISQYTKGIPKRGNSSRWSLTETVWVLFSFWWFGPRVGRVPSIHVSQKISIPRLCSSLSICQIKELDSMPFFPLKNMYFDYIVERSRVWVLESGAWVWILALWFKSNLAMGNVSEPQLVPL